MPTLLQAMETRWRMLLNHHSQNTNFTVGCYSRHIGYWGALLYDLRYLQPSSLSSRFHLRPPSIITVSSCSTVTCNSNKMREQNLWLP
ncbi:hypothetical protein SLA2020_322680 [Shorea laevis]